MHVSVSKSQSNENHCQNYFGPLELKDGKELAAVMVGRRNWSPILWDNGIRNRCYFLGADICVLDFDDGVTIADVATACKAAGLRYLIGTTKSHQKEKSGKPPCDRFRLAIPTSSVCGPVERYEQHMANMAKRWGADFACKDGARQYVPCTAIVASSGGNLLEWDPYTPPPPPSPEELEARARRLERIRTTGKLPPWIYDALRGEVGAVGRNQTLFRLAKHLVVYGVPEAEVMKMILESAFPLSQEEKERVGRNGIRAAYQRR